VSAALHGGKKKVKSLFEKVLTNP